MPRNTASLPRILWDNEYNDVYYATESDFVNVKVTNEDNTESIIPLTNKLRSLDYELDIVDSKLSNLSSDGLTLKHNEKNVARISYDPDFISQSGGEQGAIKFSFFTEEV